MKKERVKKPFIVAAVSLIVILVLTFASSFFNAIGLPILSSLASIFIFIATILTFVGFYYLGKKNKSKWLMRTIIAGFVLYIALTILSSYVSMSYSERFVELNNTLSERIANLEQLGLTGASAEVIASYEADTFNYLVETMLPFIIAFISGYLIFAIYSTFFGISMIKLRLVKYSKVIGILTIIAVWLVPTIIGIFIAIPLSLVVYILMILMFFSESKKAKE